MQYLKTLQRPSSSSENELTMLWTRGVSIADLVYDEELQFAVHANGKTQILPDLDGKKPVAWLTDVIRRKALRLPSKPENYGSAEALADSMRKFIFRYFDAD